MSAAKATLHTLGELRMIRRLVRGLPRRRNVAVGPGDDCAVVRPEAGSDCDLLLKSDPVIEGVHFSSQTPGRAIGHKALGRALSDIAAMGGKPLWALVDFVAPGNTPAARLIQVRQGISSLSRRSGMAVVGGDLSAGPALEVHVFVVGQVEKGKAILRSGARPGDSLFVTGALGGSVLGKHLRFMPRLAEGRWLCRQGWARAMIDVSDGLATDLWHLVEQSRVGAELWLGAIPVSAAAGKFRNHPEGSAARLRRGKDQARKAALQHALEDGEDFELLLAVPAAKMRAFQKAWKKTFTLACTRIGIVTSRRGVIETVSPRGKRERMGESGYEHFR